MTFTATTIRKLRALGLDQDTFDAVLLIFEDAKEIKTKEKGECRGPERARHRLPDDWKLPDDYRQYAVSIGLRPNEIGREEVKFRNYWTSQSGDRGVKLSWKRTFENWCISMLERAGRPILTPNAIENRLADGPDKFSNETWRAIAKRYKITGQWNAEFGPPPGRMDCLMPEGLL